VADHHRWLEVLQGATNYRELQSVFSQMAADASAVNNASLTVLLIYGNPTR